LPAFRLKPIGIGPAGHHGEVFACAFSPDSRYIVSGGWDAHLRIWDSVTGHQFAGFQVGSKPVSACAFSPDGTRLYAGSLDGFLSQWDAVNYYQVSTFVGHPRPISAITFAPDEKLVATASWDRTIVLRDLSDERQGRTLHGHSDIISGCCFTPDGKSLLSWSYDGGLSLWTLAQSQKPIQLTTHADRITAASLSPDGRWTASGSRDGKLTLCNIEARREVCSHAVEGEVRACLFLRDGKSLVVINQEGRLSCLTIPDMEIQEEFHTDLRIQCAALAPAGNTIALGCDDGQVRLVALDDFDSVPLVVNLARQTRRSCTRLQRILGKSTVTHVYHCTCPVCRHPLELPVANPGDTSICSGCRRSLRVGTLLSN
jgi:WD40 repeat protein